MAGKRRTTEEISHVLTQAEAGVPIKELCRKYGVADSTFYAWRKKRASEARLPLPIPQRPNELWTMDFMADRLASGARFRTLNVLDVSSQKCVGIAAERSFLRNG